jgi:transposase
MAVLRLSQEQWAFIQHYLPEQHMERPRSRDQECFEAILYKLKSGCQWELLPNEYPPKSTVHDRYLVWKKAKVFYRLFRKTRCKHPAQAVVHIDATIRLAKRGRDNLEGGEVQIEQNYCSG